MVTSPAIIAKAAISANNAVTRIDNRDRVVGTGGASGTRGCVTVSDAAVEVVVSWQGMDETVDGAVGGSAALCGQADTRRRSVRIATTIVEGI